VGRSGRGASGRGAGMAGAAGAAAGYAANVGLLGIPVNGEPSKIATSGP